MADSKTVVQWPQGDVLLLGSHGVRPTGRSLSIRSTSPPRLSAAVALEVNMLIRCKDFALAAVYISCLLQVNTKAEVRFAMEDAHWLPKEVKRWELCMGLLVGQQPTLPHAVVRLHSVVAQVAERLAQQEAGRINKTGVLSVPLLARTACHAAFCI